MKKCILLTVSIALLLSACTKKEVLDNPNNPLIINSNRMLLLKVDYLTQEFEGGTELIFDSFVTSDSIPLIVNSTPAGDFGDITILHQPTGDSIFFGTIVWNGLGQRYFPDTLQPAASYDMLDNTFSIPIDTLQHVGDNYAEDIANPLLPNSFDTVFNAIHQLSTVKNYLDDGAHLGLFTYTPSVGVGNPADWDYYIMLYK